MKKRVLSLLLVFVMVLGMLPANVFAAELLTGYNFSLNADKDVIQAGESVTLTVELDNTIPVEAGATMIQFELWYDSTVVKETSMTNGPDYTHVPTGGAENDFGEIGKGVTTFGWCADDNEPVAFPSGTLATIVYTAVEDIEAESLETTFALELYVCDYISEDLVVATPEVTVTVEKPAEEPADPAESAEFVIKVNDAVMELVDGGIQSGCDSRYVSADVQLFNVTVPAGTTTVTVELKEGATATYANIQYMVEGSDHVFGGNAMPAFEADIATYDGLCINCNGKYYHVTFTVEEKAGAYQSITTDMEGDVLVTEQEMIDGWIPYYHAVVPRGSGYAYVTYPADTIYVYGGQALVVEYAFDYSYSPQKQWPAAENTDGSVTVAVPITDLLVEEIGTGYAVCFWKADGGEVLEGFTFSYAEDTTVFLVTLAAGNGYTTDGAGYVKNGEDYSFTVDIKNGYDATNMVVKVNGEVVTPDENGVYTVTNVTADLVITVEGVEAIPSDGDVTFYFSVEEGDHFVEQGGVVWALEEVTVPYFDLAAYGMEYLYYNPDCYSEGQASQAPGTKEQADGVVTMLHALIWLTEVYYNDLDPADAGQGWLYENGWPGFSVYSATAGSAFFHMWDFGYNFNYYMNYEYPLGYPGWGATCDQIKLSDGDVVSMRYNDNSGNVGTYHHFGEKALVTKTVNKGQSFDLDIYRTGEDYANYTTPVYLVGEGHKVYLFAKDEIETTPASGTLMATTDENGKVTIDTTDLELGTYYLVSNSSSPAVMLLTIEGGDHIHEYDAVVTDPTCTERGYTTYTCECGDSYVSDYTDPTGHNFVDGECANGCGTTATVIPEEALFTDITCDVPGVITVTYEGVREWYPYFHVVLPADATKAYVTFPADSVQGNGGYAWVRGIDFTGETWATDYSPTYTVNEDGTWTIELSINNFYAEEAWQGIAACFWKDGSVNQAISFCNAAGEGGEEPVEPEYKSEYGITVMVGGEELDLVDNGTETCGVMQAQKLTVTVPAGTTEVTFLNITDTVVYGQMYIYSGAHDWTEYASNVTEATINLEECGTSFCISDSANNWYHVTIVVEEPEPSYKSEYGITVMVGDEEMDLVDNGTEACGVMQAQKLTVTVPAGTTEVTFLNITDTVVYGQMYIYSGAHDWTEYASNVTEATINLEECGTSFCISDSANNWYHVTIVVEEPEPSYKSEYGITVMVGGEELDLVDNGTETCGVMQAQKLTVTVPAGTTEVTFLNITDTVVYGQMYIYNGSHNWEEFASNVTEATINLEECGTSFCISDSANNWYHVTIVVEEPEPEKPEAPFTVTVGGEEMTEFTTSDLNTPYTGVKTLYTVTIPAGTTEVTITWNDGSNYTMSYYDANCNYFSFEAGMQNSWTIAMDKNGDGVYDMLEIYDSSYNVPYWITFVSEGEPNPDDPEEPEVPEDDVFVTIDVSEYSGTLEEGYFFGYGPSFDMSIDNPFAAGEIYETSFNSADVEQAEIAFEYDNSIIIGWEVNGVECIGPTELVYKEYEVADDVYVCFYTPNYVGFFFGLYSYDYAGSGEFTVKPIFAPAHEHSYEAVVTKPTCTEGGYTTYTCSCGDSYIADETDALGHSYVAGVCTRCGEEDADYVAPTVTVNFSISDDANYLVGAETGEVMALKEITVPYFDLALYGLEGFYFSSETYGDDGDGLPGSDLAPGTPEYADGKVTLLHLYIYALEVYHCGLDEADAGKGYLYNEGLLGTEVLDVGGSQGSAFLNYIWGVDMNLNYYVNYEYPLASEGWGATCDQILLRDGDIMTLGHFTGWSFYSDPTSIFNYIVSDNDNPTQGDEITLTLYHAGADFSGNYTTAHTVIDYCPDVYYVLVDELSSGDVTEWTYLGTAEADGTLVVDTSELEAGEYIIAIAGQYGEYYPDEICSTPGGVILTVETCEHSEYSSVVTAPTCTEDGYTTYTCKQCGHSYTDDETAALGHTEVVDAAVAPTCTETGLTEGKHCSVCEEVLVAQTEVAALGHTEVVDAAVAPTCTETGLTEGKHCSVCEEVLVAQTEVAALGHTEVVDAAVAPTCTETGLTEGKHCSMCEEVLVAQTEVAALGHTEVVDAAVAPTCTETGLTEGKHCSVCDEVLVAQDVVPANGHTDENKDYTCDTCGADLCTEHVEEVIPAVAPTCTTTGLTEGKKCSVCGDILVAQTEVAALGHTWDEGKVTTDPTCTAEGVKTFTCTVEGCNGTKTEPVAALGHTWDEGKVTTEATCTTEGVKTYTCTICGETKTEAVAALGHTVDEKTWKHDGTNHWHECETCGEKLDTAKHCGGKATTEKKAVCDVCDSEYGALAPTNPQTGDNSMLGAFVLLMMLSAAALVLLLVYRKRHMA